MAFTYNYILSFRGADCDPEHYLLLAKGRH